MPHVNLFPQIHCQSLSSYGHNVVSSPATIPCTHCNPTRLNVNNAIRVASERPLIEGVPAHRAACGIVAIRVLAYARLPLHQSKMRKRVRLRFMSGGSARARGCGFGVAGRVRLRFRARMESYRLSGSIRLCRLYQEIQRRSQDVCAVLSRLSQDPTPVTLRRFAVRSVTRRAAS